MRPVRVSSMRLHADDLTDHARLADLDTATPLRVRNLRLDTGRLIDLDLRRFEMFTDDAIVVIGSSDGDRPMARPDVVLLRGAVRNDAGSRVFVSVSRFGSHGYVETGGELHFISTGAYDAEAAARFRLHVTDAALMPEPPDAESFCGVEHDARGLNPFDIEPVADGGGAAGPGDGDPPCRVARIAWETDWEFTGALFGGNTQASADYATTLAGAVSEIYLRDVRVRHAISFLRVWDSNNDPWNGGNTGAQLTQFRDYWRANMGHVGRELAHMLSGRNLGGGIAYLGVVCSYQWGYAVSANINGFFPYPLRHNSGQNWDPYVTAHEAGHNHGTGHTHEYNPPIDNCGNGNCQNANLGTIMSYCHTCTGGVSNIRLEFHPRVIDQILSYLDSTCDLIDPNNCTTYTLPTGFSVGFGALQSGDAEDLHESDDNYVRIQQRAAVAPTLPVVRLDAFGSSSLFVASEVTYTLEAAATALPANVPQTIQLYDFDANTFETIDSRMATTSDSVVDVTIADDPSRFIVAGSGSVWARLNWFDPGDVLFAAWGVRIDQAVWAFTP
jgi:hypothetical protein